MWRKNNMKGQLHSLTGGILLLIVGLASSGCVEMMAPSRHMADSMNYVRLHKGEGTRRALLGTEAELTDNVVKFLEKEYTIVREPHAVLAKAREASISFSYAFYFYPSQTNGQTEVEVLIASNWITAAEQLVLQKKAVPDFLPLAYIKTRLLEKEYDPNVKDGSLLALSTAAMNDYRGAAKQLIRKGANVDAAISELKERASMNVPYLDRPANKSTYDKANAGVELLTKLKRTAKRSGAEKVSEARFHEALRAYRTAAVKPPLPEAARQFMVQAEGTVRDKDYQEAADLYEQALGVAPWWPEGHFNLALVLAETDDPDLAIFEMTRYLALVPNAPDVRAAQDKIYDWQRKAAKLQ
jgi:tetratricopeptide (TPR) repeat protein